MFSKARVTNEVKFQAVLFSQLAYKLRIASNREKNRGLL